MPLQRLPLQRHVLCVFVPICSAITGQRERAKATLDLIATCSEIIEGVEPSWFVASGH